MTCVDRFTVTKNRENDDGPALKITTRHVSCEAARSSQPEASARDCKTPQFAVFEDVAYCWFVAIASCGGAIASCGKATSTQQ